MRPPLEYYHVHRVARPSLEEVFRLIEEEPVTERRPALAAERAAVMNRVPEVKRSFNGL